MLIRDKLNDMWLLNGNIKIEMDVEQSGTKNGSWRGVCWRWKTSQRNGTGKRGTRTHELKNVVRLFESSLTAPSVWKSNLSMKAHFTRNIEMTLFVLLLRELLLLRSLLRMEGLSDRGYGSR